MQIITLRCPKCRNTMKYQAKDKNLSKKVKACVYCGRSFRVKGRVVGD